MFEKILPLVCIVNLRFLLLVCSPFNEDFYLGKCPHCVSREFFISRNPVNHGPLDAYPRDTPSLRLYSEFDIFFDIFVLYSQIAGEKKGPQTHAPI